MKTDCPTVSLPVATPAHEPRLLRGLYAALDRVINTAGFVSVDLTDTVSISLHTARVRAAETRANCSE